MKYVLTTIKKVSSGSLINLPIDMYLDEPLEIMKHNSVVNHEEINVVYTEMLENKLKTCRGNVIFGIFATFRLILY